MAELTSRTSLQIEMARGAFWSLVEKLGSQGVSFLVFIFVARLIGPKEYGLATFCFVFFSFGNILISGLADGIVSLQIEGCRRLSTLFWCLLAIGGGLTALTFACAGAIAELTREPRLQHILEAFSPVFIFLSAAVVPNKLLYARLRFRVLAVRTVVASLISGFLGLLMAYEGLGAYAIVVQQLSMYMMINIVVWSCIEWRPRLKFDVSSLRESLSPGLKLASSDIISVVEGQVPRLLIGSVLGPIALGYYAFATRIRFAVIEIFIGPPFSALCPSLIQIRKDQDAQMRLLGDVLTAIGLLILPLLALGADTANITVPILFGDAWTPAIPIVQILLFGSAIIPLDITMHQYLRAYNLLDLYLKVQVPAMMASLLVLAFLIPYGIFAVSLWLVCWYVVCIPFYIFFFERRTGISLWGLVCRLANPLVATLVMLAVLRVYEGSSIYPDRNWMRFFSSLGVGILAYIFACCLIQYQQVVRIIAFAKETLRREVLPRAS